MQHNHPDESDCCYAERHHKETLEVLVEIRELLHTLLNELRSNNVSSTIVDKLESIQYLIKSTR